MRSFAVLMTFVFGLPPLSACTFCVGGFQARQTFRERSSQSTILIHGTITKTRFAADGLKGETDLKANAYLKTDRKFGEPETFTIPQYLPAIGDTPKEYLVYAGLLDGKFDVSTGIAVPAKAIDFIKLAIALPVDDPTRRLAFFFKYLDDAEPVISNDAFLEFAKASDAEIANAAKSFDLKKLRTWLIDPKTPADRLGVYALMLGLIGEPDDVKLFQTLLTKEPDKLSSSMLGGYLAALTLLDSKAGWQTIETIITDAKQPFDRRLTVMTTIRYFQASKPKDSKSAILAIAKPLIDQGDFADFVVEDLRRWGWFDLTGHIVSQFEKPTHAAMIVKQSIIRYALTCNDEPSQAFIKTVRTKNAALVGRVEESLKQLEAGRSPPRQ